MKRPVLIVSLALSMIAAAATDARPPRAQAERNAEIAGTRIHQEINFFDPEIHYWFSARNPAGVSDFCVTLRLEKKRRGGWRGIGKGRARRTSKCCAGASTECFPGETRGVSDLFLYPLGKVRRKVRHGRLRIHGFTDLGPSVKLRLDEGR